MSYVRRRWLLFSLGAFGFLLVVLALLALPLRNVPTDARAAQDELTRAVEALKASDADQGWKHVAKARGHVDDVTDTTDGVGARIWSVMPVVGSGVRDARHLASAMDDLTTSMETAEEVYPQVSGEDSELLDRGSVNLEVLDTALTSMERISDRMRSAEEHLHEVKGTNALVGDTTADARDTALAKVEPVVKGLDRLDPLLAQMPDMLGGDGKRTYVIAMMNPAEMKYSGGSMLTFSHVDLDDGKLVRGRVRDSLSARPLFKQLHWRPVKGNTLAADGARRITHASIAPSWPVGGEETLRAWDIITRMDSDGLVVLDVQALAQMVAVTGPLEVKNVGTVTSDNLVELTAGDYGNFAQDEQRRRKRLNKALIPAFMDRIFSGVDFVGTMRALNESAKGRHLAFYLRDDDAAAAMSPLGFDGALSDTDHDYVGVFTQNMVGSKADYFQQKTLRSDVRLREDGSARVTLEAEVHNFNPPQAPGDDNAYTNPTLDMTVASFLPKGAELVDAVAVDPSGEESVEADPEKHFGRGVVAHQVVLDSDEKVTLRLTYDVPQAAVVDGDRMRYRLDVDPHPTVRPENIQVTVHWPKGFSASSLPTGWTDAKGTSRWKLATLPGITSWTLTARR
ncbi:DUF4012 domain-containing protein [Nocardioides daphniae]|uniref:DUF4012 domain-containing protein n=1 Tax=Nocardioides daphniae TaxID=402297 RepID=UPI001315A211|nr:DUF4012 domain-containing protein [Nocardioides daphniae]